MTVPLTDPSWKPSRFAQMFSWESCSTVDMILGAAAINNYADDQGKLEFPSTKIIESVSPQRFALTQANILTSLQTELY